MLGLALSDIEAARNQAENHRPSPLIERPESASPAPDQAARDVQAHQYRRYQASATAGENALKSVLTSCAGRTINRGDINFRWLGDDAGTTKGPDCGTPEQNWRGVGAAMNRAYGQTN